MKKSIDRIYELCHNLHVLLKIQAAMDKLEHLVISIDSEGWVRIDPSELTSREEYCRQVINEASQGTGKLGFSESVLILINLEKNL